MAGHVMGPFHNGQSGNGAENFREQCAELGKEHKQFVGPD